MSSSIKIIGMGTGSDAVISKKRVRDVHDCNILIGANRLLEQFNGISAKKIPITSDLNRLIKIIKNNIDKKIVVLASGDPNIYGISDFILKNFLSDDVNIYPNISSMQLAFAAAKISMNRAVIVSAHGRDIERIVDAAISNKKVGIFTTNEDTPRQIAQVLKERMAGDFDIYICEDLGYETERITKTDLDSISSLKTSPLNVMILLKKDGKDSHVKLYANMLGTPDDAFYHKDGMITKSEIRVLDISKLKLSIDSIIWDIGAGCGSLSVESASIAHKGVVFSIERDFEQFDLICQNIKKFGIKNIKIVNESAPDVLRSLPSPDRIFIGGSGGRLRSILHLCKDRIKADGIIVVNAVTLNTLIESTSVLKEMGFNIEVFTVNISKTKELNENHLFKSTNPIYIVRGVKAGSNS